MQSVFDFLYSVWSVSHSEKNSARHDKLYIGVHVKFAVFLSDFSETLIFAGQNSEKQISSFVKLCPEGAELSHADGRISQN